jgi:hypothetical protein
VAMVESEIQMLDMVAEIPKDANGLLESGTNIPKIWRMFEPVNGKKVPVERWIIFDVCIAAYFPASGNRPELNTMSVKCASKNGAILQTICDSDIQKENSAPVLPIRIRWLLLHNPNELPMMGKVEAPDVGKLTETAEILTSKNEIWRVEYERLCSSKENFKEYIFPSPDEHLKIIDESENHVVLMVSLNPILLLIEIPKVPKLTDSIFINEEPVVGNLSALYCV